MFEGSSFVRCVDGGKKRKRGGSWPALKLVWMEEARGGKEEAYGNVVDEGDLGE